MQKGAQTVHDTQLWKHWKVEDKTGNT